MVWRNERIWLFMDRRMHADDNAKCLFEYSIKQDDDIKKYFIVDKKSEFYDKMLKIGKNIVPWASLKHEILYLRAEKIISSHPDLIILNPFEDKNPKFYSGLTTIKRCFLQHGVTKDDVSWWLRRFDQNLYLFVTSSDFERDSILNGNYRYSEDVVQNLGMPRYDYLKNDSLNKQILFMPTWRNFINDEDSFKNSEYCGFLNGFFRNETLLNMLEDNGYEIIFKPHPLLLEFVDLLDVPDDVYISHDESYHELFNKSFLLITDYSSVSFDFAYLKKPVIYYRGDDHYHNPKGYFDYETMGFGDVIRSEKDLIHKINEYMDANFQMEDKYMDRVDKFFKFNDRNNCKRVYEWLYDNKG